RGEVRRPRHEACPRSDVPGTAPHSHISPSNSRRRGGISCPPVRYGAFCVEGKRCKRCSEARAQRVVTMPDALPCHTHGTPLAASAADAPAIAAGVQGRHVPHQWRHRMAGGIRTRWAILAGWLVALAACENGGEVDRAARDALDVPEVAETEAGRAV